MKVQCRSAAPCRNTSVRLAWAASCLWICCAGPGLASTPVADWPMWRCDAGHTAASPHDLPDQLHAEWTRQYAPRIPVWEDPLNRDMMPYDTVFEPVAAGGRVFVGFNDSDKLVAFKLETGEELWTFYAGGPIRFSPVASADAVHFVSDDGFLYCVDARSGRLRWRFRGGPTPRKAIGNGRVISAWPARGGPVLRDGRVYFAASIWPFMGVFIYALDAETGEMEWIHDGTSAAFAPQPHKAPAFAGVAPQGQLAATARSLLVPGGRSGPAVLDRSTGELSYFNFGGKGQGGSFVAADESRFFVHTRVRGTIAYNLSDGGEAGWTINEPVLSEGMTYAANTPGQEDGRTAAAMIQAFGPDKRLVWQIEADGSGDLIKSGRRLYAAGRRGIVAIEPPSGSTPPRIAWSLPVEGSIRRLLAAGDKLLAVTLDGRIMAFGSKSGSTRLLADSPRPIRPSGDAVGRAERLLELAGAREGYALWFGLDDDALLEAVLAQSDLRVVGVDPDAKTVDSLRRRWNEAGLYGNRVALDQDEAIEYQAPPYIASLIVVGQSMAGRLSDPKAAARICQSVRPYGGKLWIAAPPDDVASLAGRLRQAGLEKAEITETPAGVLATRVGPLPGAADWTHAYGDIANTVKSNDRRVKLPLGLLWFGGNSNADILPRHGHGPSEQVLGGRLFIEGMNCMSARDAYTGRVLWKRDFDDLGTFNDYYDDTYEKTPLSTAYNQVHVPGANARGTNYVATEEGVYLAIRDGCLLLDAATGETIREFRLPAAPGRRGPQWGFIGVYKNLLLAGVGFANYSTRLGYVFTPEGKKGPAWAPDREGSLGLSAFDRHSGKTLWTVQAAHSFLHNGIVAGNDRIYCLDKLPQRVEEQNKRRGADKPPPYRIVALDAQSGRPLWERKEKVFGTWLSYSEKYDVLLQAGAAASDRSLDEVGVGMMTFRGVDGSLVWEKPELNYAGPCMLHNDTIITNNTSYKESAGAFHLLDGSPVTIANPITGRREPWRFTRTYGCNTAVASEHLLTFRSGAAGFYDLTTHCGTGNFGGFKSGCSSNLIVADGLLNAPDYTRTCVCGYQNQTSLALVPMPENELWTYNLFQADGLGAEPLRRLGVNLGAPGDRRSADGTLWIDYPSVGGQSPEIDVQLDGALDWFRRHSSRISGDGPPWIAASGATGVRRAVVRVTTADDSAGPTRPAARKYTVRLHFVEPDAGATAGQRVFHVAVQGEPVLRDLDVVAQAGGANRSLVKEFSGIPVADELTIDLQSVSARPPVLCGVELVREGL